MMVNWRMAVILTGSQRQFNRCPVAIIAAMARRSKSKPAAAPSPRRLWFIALLITSVAVLAYADSFDAAFVYDDIQSIVDNPNLRTLWPITEAIGAPDESTLSGRPVASL